MIAIRASSLGRRCGVYSALSGLVPRDAGQSEAMDRGTRIHVEIQSAILVRPNIPIQDTIRALGYTAAADAMVARMEADGIGRAIRPVRAEVGLAYVATWAVLHGTIDALYMCDGCAVGVDWKTGHCGGLPPIESDMQMRAYAYLASAKFRMPAYIMRVQTDTGVVDVLDLRRHDAGAKNREAVHGAMLWHSEHLGEPASARSTCASCPISAHCRHYCAGVVRVVPELATITADDGVPTVTTSEDARRVAMVLRPARAVLDRLERELRAWVTDHGAVEDTGRARTWGHSLRLRDVITDHPALLAELASETDDGRAWSTAATTKQGVLRALMDGGLTRQEALAWWEVRREMGMIAKKATDIWGWSDE